MVHDVSILRIHRLRLHLLYTLVFYAVSMADFPSCAATVLQNVVVDKVKHIR